MADRDIDLFEIIRRHYCKRLGAGKITAVDVFNEILDVLARLLATQPRAKVRAELCAHVGKVLPGMVEIYFDAQVKQRDFGTVAPKRTNAILTPTEAEKRFVAQAKGEPT